MAGGIRTHIGEVFRRSEGDKHLISKATQLHPCPSNSPSAGSDVHCQLSRYDVEQPLMADPSTDVPVNVTPTMQQCLRLI